MERYEKYKDSGVKWIGEIPNDWELLRLKYASEIIGRIGFRGYTIADIVEKNLGAISLSPSNIFNQKLTLDECTYISWEKYDESPEIQIFPRDIVMVKTGSTIGKVAIIPDFTDKITINPQLVVLKNLKLDPKFIYYTVTSRYFQSLFVIYSAGGSTPAISQEKMNNFSFVAPPSLTEQTAIANYLDKKTSELDTLITKKERLIELLKEERTAIINQAVTKGLDPDVEMKDSGVEWLGEIPAHWDVKKLKYVFNSLNTVRVPLNAEERGNMSNKVYDYYGASGIIDLVDNYLFDQETILIGEDGANLLTRSKRLAFIAKGKYWVNNHAHILQPKTGNIEYLCEMLELLDYTEYVSGSAQPKLTQEALMSIEIFEPPVEEQELIIQFVKKELSRVDTIISKTEQEITLLKEYKTALISEVVTGKVKVV